MPTLNPADLVAQAAAKAKQYAERGAAELHYVRKMFESGALKLESPKRVSAMAADIVRWGEIGMIPSVNARRTPHRVAVIDDE
ncbi:MAG: acyl-CoA synthetase, partial [Mycobacterium sp.]